MDIFLTDVSDHNLLHLNLPHSTRENSMLWLLGQYLEYVETDIIQFKRRSEPAKFKGRIYAKLFLWRNKSTPDIGFIPGIEPTGIG